MVYPLQEWIWRFIAKLLIVQYNSPLMRVDNSVYSEQLLQEKYDAYKVAKKAREGYGQIVKDWDAGLSRKPWLIAEFQRFFEIGCPDPKNDSQKRDEVVKTLRQRPGYYPLETLKCELQPDFGNTPWFRYSFRHSIEENNFVVNLGGENINAQTSKESALQVEIPEDRQQDPILHLPKGFKIPLVSITYPIIWNPPSEGYFLGKGYTPHFTTSYEYALWEPELSEFSAELTVPRALLDKISWSKTPESTITYS